MLKGPYKRWLSAKAPALREQFVATLAIAAAVRRIAEPSLARRALVASRLLVAAKAERYEVTDFYLPTVHYVWRRGDGGPRSQSVAQATTDGALDERLVARFTLHAESGAVIAEWNGRTARALLVLGRLAGSRESSPYASPDDRFDFERPEEHPVTAE